MKNKFVPMFILGCIVNPQVKADEKTIDIIITTEQGTIEAESTVLRTAATRWVLPSRWKISL